MKTFTIQFFIVLTVIISLMNCKQDKKFNRYIWLRHNLVEEHNNPRSWMLDDLQTNIIEVGLTKKEILSLLGDPAYEGIDYRLPAGMKLPDSLSLIKYIGKSQNERAFALEKFNRWFRTHSTPINILSYPVGWSLMDPKSFIVKLDSFDRVDTFWVEQH